MKKANRSIIFHSITFLLTLFLLVMVPGMATSAAWAISAKTATIDVGATKKLTVKGLKKKTKVAWKSSNPAVASVSAKGVVKGKKAGSARITATVNKKKYTCKVKVRVLRLNTSAISMTEGGVFRLSITGGLTKADKVAWSSSNTAVATVSAGAVTGIGAGTARISAKVGKKSYFCTVVVGSTPKLSVNTLTLQKGGKFIVSMKGASGTVTWSTSNSSVATVSSTGMVTAVNTGTARITASTGGNNYICTVTVKAAQTTTKPVTTTVTKPVTGQTETVTTPVASASNTGNSEVKVSDGQVPASLRPSASNSNYASYDWARQLSILNRMMKAYNTIYKYHDGLNYTNAHYYEWFGGIYRGGYGCAGFCFELSDAAFIQAGANGSVTPMGTIKMISSLSVAQIKDTIRIGDILRIEYNTHSVIVIAKEDTGVVVAEANYNSAVKWGRRITYADIKKTGTNILSRYDSTPITLGLAAKLAEGLPILDGMIPMVM